MVRGSIAMFALLRVWCGERFGRCRKVRVECRCGIGGAMLQLRRCAKSKRIRIERLSGVVLDQGDVIFGDGNRCRRSMRDVERR